MCIDKIGEIVEQSDYLGLSVGRSFFTLIALIFLCMAEFCGQFAVPSMPSHKVRWA